MGEFLARQARSLRKQLEKPLPPEIIAASGIIARDVDFEHRVSGSHGAQTPVRLTVAIYVLLDVFRKREPHYAASARVLAMVQQRELDAVLSAHGFTTLYYLVRKHASLPDAEAAICFALGGRLKCTALSTFFS